MDIPPEAITATIGVVGAAGGTITTGWIAKLLISRYIKQNDEKHQSHDNAVQKILSKLEGISTDVAVIKNVLSQISLLKSQVAADHDKIVQMSTWNEKYKDDLKQQWTRVRSIEKDVEDVSKLISSLRGATVK